MLIKCVFNYIFCNTVVIDSVTGGVILHHSSKMHRYINSLSKRYPSRGQLSFCRQLHLGWSWVFSSDRILLLCDFVMLIKLVKQVKLPLTLFLLNILWKLLVFGKYLSINFRNVFPVFVSTFTLYGGLNHIIFLWKCQILLISKIFFVPTRRQYVVIGRCGIIKCCFIGWNIGYSFWNVIWKCFDDIRSWTWYKERCRSVSYKIDIFRCKDWM